MEQNNFLFASRKVSVPSLELPLHNEYIDSNLHLADFSNQNLGWVLLLNTNKAIKVNDVIKYNIKFKLDKRILKKQNLCFWFKCFMITDYETKNKIS